jgi:trimethylamine--corrinoid protein Co-methyltransferase
VELEYGCKVIDIYAKNNQPITLDNLVLSGAAWPATLAGAIVLRDTEILSGLILAQIINPGLPIISGCAGGFTGIESDTISIQAPERSIVSLNKNTRIVPR